ncbi:MAG: LysR family transcriptional regulator [Casimicrobiaceae bacterium]
MTIKQLEAFYWVTRLRTFAAAASKLHATQSTISSRIQLLEQSLGTRLFDRESHAARLTAKGRELVPQAERLLGLVTQIRGTVGNPRALSGVIRVGVAEFVAHAWLSRWAAAANERYPGVVLEMDVDLTLNLRDKLASGRIDLALLPGPLHDPGLVEHSLGGVQFEWMANPSLGVPTSPLRPADFQGFPLILLSEKSNLHAMLLDWFESAGVTVRRVDIVNSLATVATLTLAGLGIAYLPLEYHRADLDAGRLQLVEVEPHLPPLEYVTAHRRDLAEPLVPLLAHLARDISDFARLP